jgi:hypothetical protein
MFTRRPQAETKRRSGLLVTAVAVRLSTCWRRGSTGLPGRQERRSGADAAKALPISANGSHLQIGVINIKRRFSVYL